ncbi:uncharacterized protein LOC105261849 [Musca domestica]|uniref:Uncharacterized protein LOC105261849 n=1 Tax=Musca domestica TaxID=7370 RepID=A0A9J7D8E5_MUSDO|nr:uncharacterized protein LOC105261849 [Musca domestica]
MSNKRKIDLMCSPETFKRVSNDTEFRNALASGIEGIEECDELIFSPNVVSDESMEEPLVFNPIFEPQCQLEEGCEPQSPEPDGKKSIWLDSSTKLLINKYKDLRPLVGKVASLKNKKQMWTKISEELKANGHDFTIAQVENKFYSLERQYKNMQLHNSKTGRDRQTCPYKR